MGERIEPRKRPPPPVRPRPITVTAAEDTLLGAIVLWGAEALREALDNGLRIDHLWQPRAQALYRAALIIEDRGESIDAITLHDQLRRTGEAELFASNGEHPLEGLARLDRNTQFAGGRSVRGAVSVIQQAAAQRHAQTIGREVVERVESGDIDPSEWPQLVRRWSDDLATLASTGDLSRSTGWSIDQVLDTIEHEWVAESEGSVRGISTGFAKWDDVLGRVGPRPPWLVGLAGRPGMGKSTLALSWTTACILPHLRGVHRRGEPPPEPIPVLWACSEMTAAEIGRSLVSSVGQLERRSVESPDRQWMRRFAVGRLHAVQMLRGTGLTFVPDDQAGILEEIEAVARNWRAKHPREAGPDGPGTGRRKPALIVVDYLQRLKSRTWKGREREQEINYLAQSLKTLARNLDVVVLMLCQLNRSVESRADKRPMLSDLRESGAIEQECDVVCFVYRDHYYHPDKSKDDGAEIITAKNRKGPLETVHVRFEGKYSRFLDLPAPGEEPEVVYDLEF